MSMALRIRPFQDGDEAAVVALWRACSLVVPWNDPHDDVARKMAVQPDLLLVGLVDDAIVASVMAGYEGHRGWLNYLAVAPEVRGNGYGRAMVRAAEVALAALGCPKVNLQIRSTNAGVIAFYRALGYRVDDVVSMGRRL